MTVADELERALAGQLSTDGATVEEWGFEVSSGESLRVGLKDNVLGGPFGSPAYASAIRGSMRLRWSDGLETRTSLDAECAAELPARLPDWREAAFHDPWAVPIPEPIPTSEFATADSLVEEMVSSRPERLFELLDRGRRTLVDAGLRHVDGSVSAVRGRRWIRSSSGLRVVFPETAFTVEASAEELYWEAYAKRRAPEEHEAASLFERVATLSRELTEDDGLPSGEVSVLLTPPVTDSFLGRFLGMNLGGTRVAVGHSSFGIEDFRVRRAVLREDLDVIVDTTLPYELATSPCSADGVAGGRVALIEAGRLATPRLTRRVANRVGLPPTPKPRGSPALLLESRLSKIDEGTAVEDLELGLVVYSVIGLHTQPSQTGRYSVVAPQSQVVREGRRGGKMSARLSGNFLDHLRDTSTQLVRFSHRHNPGLLVRCTVTGDHSA